MTRTPEIPLLIEHDADEYQDSGVVSTVAIAKHPLHPLIVTFPIAFLTGALGTDIGYWLTGDLFWSRVMDFLRIDRVRKRRAGWFHMVGNIMALGFAFINWMLRLNQGANAIIPVGLTLSVIVGGILGLTGWYGAELIYRHKVAVIGSSPRREL
jgi:uncharacterized membrane protein